MPRCLPAVLAAAMLLVACGPPNAGRGRSDTSHPTTTVVRGQPARVPAQLQFSATTLDRQRFSGESLLGKSSVFWFWTPWCPKCQSEASNVAHVAAANPAVIFVGVAGQARIPAMQEFVDKYHLNGLTQLTDTDGTVWAKFGVTHQPAYAFIDPNGSITVVKGSLSESQLSERVQALDA